MDGHAEVDPFMGMGDGLCSDESYENLTIAQDLCQGRSVEALPYLELVMQDERNIDAWIRLAILAPDKDVSIQTLQAAKAQGERNLRLYLGPRCFDDDGGQVGHYWGLLDTRPYMRVLQGLVRFFFDTGRFDRALNTAIEMLRLCPSDNLGQRDWVGTLLLKVNRPADALSFIQQWLELEVCETGSPPLRGGCVFKTPSQEPMPRSTVKKLGKYTQSNLVYTAAVATFKSWGDCELARQYLVIASKLNSIILRGVILSKIDQPTSPLESPRKLNGPEEAHDYLWHSQDLWMVGDVWNWADSRHDAKKYILKPCSKDGCPKQETRVVEFKLCKGCHAAWYCGKECQREDWRIHKSKCRKRKRSAATTQEIRTRQ